MTGTYTSTKSLRLRLRSLDVILAKSALSLLETALSYLQVIMDHREEYPIVERERVMLDAQGAIKALNLVRVYISALLSTLRQMPSSTLPD